MQKCDGVDCQADFKWLFKIPDTVLEGKDANQTAEIVPVLFYCMRFINEARDFSQK